MRGLSGPLGRRTRPGPWAAAGVALALAAPAGAQSPAAASAPVAAAAFPGMTAREQEYLALWTLRAGLNTAALQCQYSKALRTVDTYNAFLRQHSDELAAAYKGLDGYFARVHGARVGPRRFDTVNTRLYQQFSAVETQRAYCEKAAMVGREALFVPKGKAAAFAVTAIEPFRDTLDRTKVAQTNPLLVGIGPQPIPALTCRGGRC